MTVEFFVNKVLHYTQARQFERLPADFAVQLVTDDVRFSDRVFDISEAGIGVRTNRPLAPMSLVSMHLELPNASEPVGVLGRVMWTTGRVMGIRFERVDQRITELVQQLRRLYARL